jgi:hypothetical protein
MGGTSVATAFCTNVFTAHNIIFEALAPILNVFG